MLIYLLTNLINGKRYVGKTSLEIERRIQAHLSRVKRGSQTYIHNSIRKYGFENFKVEILENVKSPQHLNEREISWIDILKPEYNLTSGGEGGDTSKSPNHIEGMKYRNISGSKNGMFGVKRHIPKSQLDKAHEKAKEANKCPVICEGTIYSSVGEAQLSYPGIKLSRRLNSDKWPEFKRLRPKTKRKY